MIKVEFKRLGKPSEQLYLKNTEISERLKSTEVLIEVLFFPINPADLLLVEGKYGSNLPLLPSSIGAECVAKVIKIGKNVKKLPLSLGEALDRLAEDKVIQSAMPDEMYKIFHWYKNDEWEKFLGATTQWDLDTYLDCLP